VSEEADQQTPNQVAAYIAELSASLSSMARRHRLDTLGYILDMARLEAEMLTRGPLGNGGPGEPIQR
jgi:hypothetical protein